jgi:outer membrane protein assembly factor BamB
VDKDLLYCFPGGATTNLAALDRFTGRIVWSSGVLSDTFAYGSPVPVDLPDLPVLITTSRHHLFSVERESGKLLGAYALEGYEYDGEHCNTPVYDDGQVYFVGNDVEGQGAVKLELSRDGQHFKEIWRNEKIKNNFGGLVVVNGHLFTTIKGNWLVSLDPENGTVTDSLKVDGGSVIFADNKFICYGNNGTVNLVSHEDGKLAIRGELKILEGTGHHFAHPVVADGVLYIRHGNALMAYRIIQS